MSALLVATVLLAAAPAAAGGRVARHDVRRAVERAAILTLKLTL